MIKKIGIFFSAIFIALVGLFSVNPLKNTAEPQYFNKTIQNAIVETATNEYTFYLDNNVNYYQQKALETILTFQENSLIEIYTIDNTTIIYNNDFLNNGVMQFASNFESNYNMFIINTILTLFQKFENEYFNEELNYTFPAKSWLYLDLNMENGELNRVVEIIGFKLINVELETSFNVNELLLQYIGNLTSFPQDTQPQETPLDKIGSIINSIINYFVNIFTGLSDTFYNPTTNQLTLWGSVLFIGVAILLVSMVLKWLISLIKGI